MSAYATYKYYADTYAGALISDSDFARLGTRASLMIDRMTFNRAAPIITTNTDLATIDLIKMATCAVAEIIQEDEAIGNVGKITGEHIGNYSVSQTGMSFDQKLYKAASPYLWNTGLMYRGFGEDELSHHSF